MILSTKMNGSEKKERMAIMEAAISSSLSCPNIVQTYTYTLTPVRDYRSNISVNMSRASPSGTLPPPFAASAFEVRIILQSNHDDPRGVTAKVADFGLSVQMDKAETHVSGLFQGTLTHMAPETLLSGTKSSAADM